MTVAAASPSGTIVGALACQKNSYLKTLETQIISCVKQEEQQQQNGNLKSGKKAKAAAKEAAPPQEIWLVEFADSVLFPEDPIPIGFVQRQGLRCVAHSPQPVSPGTHVRQVVNWPRRWYHMQQHTGQHLLSAIMDTYDNLETLGWGMGREGEMNYVDLPRKPTPEEIKTIQDRCNEAVRENSFIKVETPEEVKHDKLPDDYDASQGVIRVINIEGIDRNPCCGTHLSQTSHISLILLHSTQSVHGKNCRLFFSAGDQAVRFATSAVSSVSSVARLLGCANDAGEVLSEATKTSQSLAELKKKEKKYLSEIAKYEGDRVRGLLQSGKSAWVYRADGGLDFLNKVIAEVKDVASQGVLVLASGEEKTAGPVVVIGEKTKVDETVGKIKEAVKEIKGGGGGNKWQGKVVSWRAGELEALKELVES
ncbi:ThrRS/AlaRS common domain-containing protein [Xylona heveae TC161]|uniref:ThrRS/AlaRS common domain-containing protein n=1 Tax=Xylona heveae (strain CBS 132557 / TC161) TaxID=1328760 RepID=A0A165FZ94_XYLHT|nr:ThrRS/AlaRS common domain-containing protein [Xylona heveae TC161]KZF21559.1 ThrRS/AlaRS common domain-containing protein [Xylona heveae TC161]